MLESIHYNLVQKINPQIGGQVFHPTHLRKSSERVTHNKRFHKISLYKSLVVRHQLQGFSQMCRMQNLATIMWSYFELSYYERTPNQIKSHFRVSFNFHFNFPVSVWEDIFSYI